MRPDLGATVELDRELRRLTVLQRREALARRRARGRTRTGATRAVVVSRRVRELAPAPHA